MENRRKSQFDHPLPIRSKSLPNPPPPPSPHHHNLLETPTSSPKSSISTPALKFFGVRIHGHPDNPPEIEVQKLEDDEDEDDDDDYNKYTQPTEIVIKHGRVKEIIIDTTLYKDLVKKEEVKLGFGQACCKDEAFDVVRSLQGQKGQARFIVRVLMIENLLRIFPFVMLTFQNYFGGLHEFLYEQDVSMLMLLVVYWITMIWAVAILRLARYTPVDSILLIYKSFGQGLISAYVTTKLEQFIVRISLYEDDFPTADHIIAFYKLWRKFLNDTQHDYTYPFLVPFVLLNVSIVYLLMCIFFTFFKGNVKNNRMFGFALGCQTTLFITLMIIFKRLPLNQAVFKGPDAWDESQMILSYVIAASWEQWRLYCFRQLFLGRKFALNENSYKRVAVSFCI